MQTTNTATTGTETRQYYKNLETGKIELKFEKADYISMPEDQKKMIKSNFLFSSYAGAWVSRAKNNTWSAENVCNQLGAIYQGERGEKLSFAEQIEVQQEKAENRAERFEKYAENAEKRSQQYYEASNEGKDFLSLGEPIKIGHHSEKRHRALIERNHNRMGKSIEEDKKASYYKDRAETAKYTAEGAQYSNPVYLGNRIKEVEARLRELNRYFTGVGYWDRVSGHQSTKENPAYVSDERKEKLQVQINEENDKLAFFKEKLLSCGIVIHSKASLKEMKCTHVKYRGTFYPVKSLNAKSVTVLNWMSIPGNAWKWSVDYTDIQDTKTIFDNYIVLDRDGNENKPQIKY